jgi:hypothetical protein
LERLSYIVRLTVLHTKEHAHTRGKGRNHNKQGILFARAKGVIKKREFIERLFSCVKGRFVLVDSELRRRNADENIRVLDLDGVSEITDIGFGRKEKFVKRTVLVRVSLRVSDEEDKLQGFGRRR